MIDPKALVVDVSMLQFALIIAAVVNITPVSVDFYKKVYMAVLD
jgi:hypothetical protein